MVDYQGSRSGPFVGPVGISTPISTRDFAWMLMVFFVSLHGHRAFESKRRIKERSSKTQSQRRHRYLELVINHNYYTKVQDV
jgi:hypothetical protein